MKTFLDSSSFAKRFVEEDGSARVEELCRNATELGLSMICLPEIISAINRRVREGLLTRKQYLDIKKHFLDDIRDADMAQLTEQVTGSAIKVLERNPVRAMDALHVACAIEWGAELFVSCDIRQLAAAKHEGLKTLLV